MDLVWGHHVGGPDKVERDVTKLEIVWKPAHTCQTIHPGTPRWAHITRLGSHTWRHPAAPDMPLFEGYYTVFPQYCIRIVLWHMPYHALSISRG